MIIDVEPHEAATTRVALSHFFEYISEEGLGDDDHGKEMVKLYKQNINSLLRKIVPDD